MQGIWLLAAGMYPLGFMFGVCSKCCDQCPDECSKCAGVYHVTTPGGDRCRDTFDALTLSTAVDVATRNNVRPDSNRRVNIAADIIQSLKCFDIDGNAVSKTITANGNYFEVDIVGLDKCECPTCFYAQGIYIGVGLSRPSSTLCYFDAFFQYDKCAQSTALVSVTITREQMEACLESFPLLQCEGVPEEISVELQFDLDFECECGACCRGSVCTENESKIHCEVNDFPSPGGGTWQGVGTSCDPNPCEE